MYPSGVPSGVTKWIDLASIRYGVPAGFLAAICERESSFDPGARNLWDQYKDKPLEQGRGLAQLSGLDYRGSPYPQYLMGSNDNNLQWRYDMGFSRFGQWIWMGDVSVMVDPFNPWQNLQRFITCYARPAFYLWKRVYRLPDPETWRATAYHWNKGLFKPYQASDQSYLKLYDLAIAKYGLAYPS